MYKLYHKSQLVGNIPSCSANGFSMHGSIELTAAADKYKALLDYWSDPDKPKSEEPPFPSHLLQDWSIEDDEGVPHEIGIPTIFVRDGKQEIFWRYC